MDVNTALNLAHKNKPDNSIIVQLFSEMGDLNNLTWQVGFFNNLKKEFFFAKITDQKLVFLEDTPIIENSGFNKEIRINNLYPAEKVIQKALDQKNSKAPLYSSGKGMILLREDDRGPFFTVTIVLGGLNLYLAHFNAISGELISDEIKSFMQ